MWEVLHWMISSSSIFILFFDAGFASLYAHFRHFFFCFIHELWRTWSKRISFFTSRSIQLTIVCSYSFPTEIRTKIFLFKFPTCSLPVERPQIYTHFQSSTFSRSRKILKRRQVKKTNETEIFSWSHWAESIHKICPFRPHYCHICVIVFKWVSKVIRLLFVSLLGTC